MANWNMASWTNYAVKIKLYILLASVTFQDNGKEYVSVKVEYIEKELEFGNSGIYIAYKNEVQINLEPP